ncbi:hypothetical protein AN639_01905 [Candidatus Epulonipiscium fishelsonii]|uniref:Uncharacterized protein n=1 Tax=Candidatus Epulonipiscium fishelsonii TaxID=77094 RepID=A0ACC8X8D9_9FIRM|nr:hypothetical protein AN396_10865 [Epulopiscium sp. SCG-B11WGA-EpuloA1]ONI38959.1 hypothetical protein AN639_01905 [Epulopiscium sp. SCG-B05WGA-EpuloA1]
MAGNVIETTFEETKVSAIESKLYKYLAMTASYKEKLQEDKNRIDELISDLSHQTKTPLANIMLYSELLSECALDENSKEYNKLLKQQVEKLNFLIQSLLKTSRLENGIICPIPKLQNISLLLDNIKSSFQNVNVVNSDILVCYDLKWTSEALINLVDNAIKYGGSKIDIEVTSYNLFCKIDVKDNGIGMKESDIPRIFTRFYRSEEVADIEGVGIGLYLAREIISKQYGYIKVKSVIGKGSVFSVFLPLQYK